MADKRIYQINPPCPQTDIALTVKTDTFSRAVIEAIGDRIVQEIINLHNEGGGKSSVRFDPRNMDRDAPMCEVHYFTPNEQQTASVRAAISIGLDNHINPHGCILKVPESLSVSIVETQPPLRKVIELPTGIDPEIKLWLSRSNPTGKLTGNGNVAGIFTDASRIEEEILLIGTLNYQNLTNLLGSGAAP